MPTLNTGIVLTPEERLARRRLILRDAMSLLTLFLITLVIFTLTFFLHRSFVNHEQVLGYRWKARGEAALRAGRPKEAVEALRSALVYIPNRGTEIELATALARAGRTQEATAYFNTLLESAPGDGNINLQLARLASKEGNEKLALLRYRTALDGTWQGNGYVLRREVRLEMIRYLLSRGHDDEARTQLLIAASNAPDEDSSVKIEIAGLLAQAQDLPDALSLYRSLAGSHNPPAAALNGAGNAAFQLGMYRVAAAYLGRALAGPDAAQLSEPQKNIDRSRLDIAQRILLLFPDMNLPPRARAERILAAKNTAHQRLTTCSATATGAPQLAPLVARWAQVPARLTVAQLAQQPDVEQSILQLVYDTETVTAQICGAPAGDDALLLRIARNPAAVEQE